MTQKGPAAAAPALGEKPCERRGRADDGRTGRLDEEC
jgi:hypothetical protein